MKKLVLPFLLSLSAHADLNWNLRTSPLQWIVGPNLRVDYRIDEQWSVGATGVYIDRVIKTVAMLESAAGVMVQFSYPQNMSSSFFVESGISYADISASALASNDHIESVKVHNISTRVQTGYQWFWGPANIAIGGGWEHNSAGDTDINDPSGNKVNRIPVRRNLFVPEASVGWAF